MTNNTWGDGNRVVHMHNNRGLSVIINNNEVYQLSHTNPQFEAALDSLKNYDLDGLRAACKPIEVVRNTEVFRAGGISISGGEVIRNGQPIHSALADRILEFSREGYPYEPLVQFMDRLYRNPSKIAVDELFLFLDSSDTPAPIMEDGRFLAYKKVRSNYNDIYSNTVNYGLGKVVEMERNEVDDERDNTCSAGLHFCSISYLSSFGSSDPGQTRIVIVAIDPADVVSIPSDYNNAKGRAARMEVVGELTEAQYYAAIRREHTFGGSYVDTRVENTRTPVEDDDYTGFDVWSRGDFTPTPTVNASTDIILTQVDLRGSGLKTNYTLKGHPTRKAARQHSVNVYDANTSRQPSGLGKALHRHISKVDRRAFNYRWYTIHETSPATTANITLSNIVPLANYF